jgi:Contractile injection system tube protein
MKAQFILVEVKPGGAGFTFQYFPQEISTSDHANYEEADTLGGFRPVMYGNNNRRRITVNELTLDTSQSGGESLTPQLTVLRGLIAPRNQQGESGEPPLLFVTFSDYSATVLLEALEVRLTYFNSNGEPIRASIDITLIQTSQVESVTTKFVTDADFSDMENFQRPVFGPQP